MSRSNPNEHAPNPAKRWFEWNGEHGKLRYYDKNDKRNIDVSLPFSFLLLDEVASVRGWHDASDSGIYSNEVRDTRTDVLVVKSFKGGLIAEGTYKVIKDRVNTAGGHFTANCYIGFKENGHLEIGSLRLKGAALNAWVEFRKAHRGQMYDGAIEIAGFTEGKKGRIVFRVPVFDDRPVSEETNREAMALDGELQEFLKGYFNRRMNDQATPPPDDIEDEPPDNEGQDHSGPLTDDDIPF